MLEIANNGAANYGAKSFTFTASDAITLKGTGLTFSKMSADGTTVVSTVDLSTATGGSGTTYTAGTGITINGTSIAVDESALAATSAITSIKTIINSDVTRKFNIVSAEFTAATTKSRVSGDYAYVGSTIDLQYVTQNMHFIKSATTTGLTLSDYEIVDVTTDFGITDGSAVIYRLLNINNAKLAAALTAGTLFTYFPAPSAAITTTAASTAGTGVELYTGGPTVKSFYIA